MPKLKLLFMSNIPYNGHITGGVQSVMKAMCDGLKYYSNDYDITVLSITDLLPNDTILETNNIKFQYLKSRKSKYRRPGILWNIPHVIKIVNSIKPDVINVIDTPTMALAALRTPYPQIFTIHGIKAKEAEVWRGVEYWSHKFEAAIEKHIHSKYTNFIAISPYVHQILDKKTKKNTSIFDIPNPVAEIFFEKNGTKVPEINRLKILNVGSYTRLKSQHILIEAIGQIGSLAEIVDTVFVGANDDPKYLKYLKEIGRQNIKICEVGSQAEIRNLMQASDILVHTSMQENMPMVFLEAMAVGLPIISSKVGGVNYLLANDKYGTTYQYGNIEELTTLIKKTFEDPGFFRDKANAASEYVGRNHKPELIALQTIKAMESVIR